MSSVSASNRFPPLLAFIVPINGLVTTALLAVLGSMVLALSAKIQIPFWPVPMELWRKLGDDEVSKVAYRGRCLTPA
jgi:biotin transport system substrate-specific component